MFAFGYFPLYEYGVISRAYALCLLLVVVACIFLRDRWRHPIRLALVLFLLSHTEVHGAILALAFLCGLVLDFLLHGRALVGDSSVALRRIRVAFLLALSGFLLSVAQLLPAPDTNVWSADISVAELPNLHFDPDRFAECLRLFPFVFFFPLGRDFDFGMSNVPLGFPDLDALYSVPVACVLLAAIVWHHRHRLVPLAMYLCSVFGLLAFFYLVHMGSALRHNGFIFIAFLVLLWSGQVLSPSSSSEESSRSLLPRRHASVLLTVFLAVHAFAGLRALMVDLVLPFSLAERTAEYLRTESLDSLPMIGEPDYAVSAVLAFLDGKPTMHYARGDRPGSFVRWDGAREPLDLTDAELLSRTAALTAREDGPVVLIMNRTLLLPLEQYPEISVLVSFTGALWLHQNWHLYLYDRSTSLPPEAVVGKR